MTLDNDALLARIELLRRVQTEHEPISRLVSQQLEVDERLVAMCKTIEAAREELEETYRVVRVTHQMPDDLVFEILEVRMNVAGGFENWCAKIEGMRIKHLGGERFPTRWLRKHLDKFVAANGGIRLDSLVHDALYFEEHDAQHASKDV